MAPYLDRPKLTRDVLRSHEIHYHEQVYVRNGTTSVPSIPDHVNKLREALLDFSGVKISDNWKTFFQEQEIVVRAAQQRRGIDTSNWDLQPPTSTYFTEKELQVSRSDWEEEKKRLNDNIYISKRISQAARKLDYDSESGWMDFLRDRFFTRYEREQNGDDEDNYDYALFDEFSLEENVLWNESKRTFQWEENFTPNIRARTGPKPDLSYGFKASPASSNQQGFGGMQYFRNFSFDILGELQSKTPAIQTTVTTGLSKWHRWRAEKKTGVNGNLYPVKLLTPDLLCFPWAVVEAKHAQGKMTDEEFCQCQLANATACAYDLQEKLIKPVDHSCPIDPIIGFTCIGPRVKLWLTYRGDDEKTHMQCIWATSIEATWGAICLAEVIGYMQLWASRVLRGKIVQYIDLAYRTSSTEPNIMRSSEKGQGAAVVDSTAGTSNTATTSNGNTENTSIREKLPGSGGTTQATGAASTRVKPKSMRRIRVKIPTAPDSKSNAAKKPDSPNIFARLAQGVFDTRINQHTGSAASTSREQETSPSKTSTTGRRTSPLNSFGTVPESTIGSSLPKLAAYSTSNATSSSWKPLLPPLFNSDDQKDSLPHSVKATPSTITLKNTTPQHGLAPTPQTPPLGASEVTPATYTFFGTVFSTVLPLNGFHEPQRSTLFSPRQRLTSSRSDTNLASNASSSASAPEDTIFDSPTPISTSTPSVLTLASTSNHTIWDRLKPEPTPSTLTSDPLRETPSETKCEAQLELPQNVSYPFIPTHARSVSCERGKKGGLGEARQRAVSDVGAGARADEAQAP